MTSWHATINVTQTQNFLFVVYIEREWKLWRFGATRPLFGGIRWPHFELDEKASFSWTNDAENVDYFISFPNEADLNRIIYIGNDNG